MVCISAKRVRAERVVAVGVEGGVMVCWRPFVSVWFLGAVYLSMLTRALEVVLDGMLLTFAKDWFCKTKEVLEDRRMGQGNCVCSLADVGKKTYLTVKSNPSTRTHSPPTLLSKSHILPSA
jgi:hypothetical protein